MPYLTDPSAAPPWLAASTAAMDPLLQMAMGDYQNAMAEGRQIRAEQRAGARENARTAEQRAYDEQRTKAGWAREDARTLEANTRADTIRKEGYSRAAAGGNAILEVLSRAGQMPEGFDVQGIMDRNAAPGPNQGAAPVGDLVRMLVQQRLLQDGRARDRQEASDIINAALSGGQIPVPSLPNAAGPGTIPRFSTPASARGYIDDQRMSAAAASMDQYRQDQLAAMADRLDFERGKSAAESASAQQKAAASEHAQRVRTALGMLRALASKEYPTPEDDKAMRDILQFLNLDIGVDVAEPRSPPPASTAGPKASKPSGRPTDAEIRALTDQLLSKFGGG